MTTLQKFKLLATQCTVVNSPTRSPTTSPSPIIHLRRRKSLRMLLTRRLSRRHDSIEQEVVKLIAHQTQKKEIKNLGKTNSLKDLFISSPEYERSDESKARGKGGGESYGKVEFQLPGSPRLVWVGFRHRLLRRVWRPMLGTIPE